MAKMFICSGLQRVPCAPENSPAIYGWVNGIPNHRSPVRDERISIQHLRLIRASVFLEKHFQLLTKASLPMMLFLRLDVTHRVIDD